MCRALIEQSAQMHSSFLPFADLAERLLSAAVELFFAFCVCECVCVAALAFTCLVQLCVQTKIILRCVWEIHTRFVCGIPECQLLLCVRAGEALGLLQWSGRQHESVCSLCAFGARSPPQREKDRVGTFKEPTWYSPKTHPPRFAALYL